MKTIKKLLCLLLCLCTVLGMVTVPASAETNQITKQSFAFEDPVLGKKPLGVEDIWINNTKYVEVESVEWKGELDANGNIKAGVAYFMVIRLKVKAGVDAGFWVKYYGDISVNGVTQTAFNSRPIDDDRQGFTLWYRLPYYFKEDGTKVKLTMINSLDFDVPAPSAGAKPAAAAAINLNNSALEIRKLEWKGELDANGCFKADTKYTVQLDVKVKDGKNYTFPYDIGSYTINDKTATWGGTFVDEFGAARVSYTFPATKNTGTITENGNTKMTIAAPEVGKRPSFSPVVAAGWNSYVSYCDWSGTFDKYGNFQSGKTYTLNVTVKVNTTNTTYKFKSGSTNVINNAIANVKSITDNGRTMQLTYTFPALEGDAVAPKGTAVEKFAAGDYGVLSVTKGNAIYYDTPDSSKDYAAYEPAPCTVIVLEAGVKGTGPNGGTWNAVLYKGKIMYMRAYSDIAATYADHIKYGSNPVGTYSDPWNSEKKQSEGMIKQIDPDVLVLENNVPKLELRYGRSTTPGEAGKEFYLDTTVYSATKPEPYTFVTAVATYRANPGHFFYEKITYAEAPRHLLQKGCSAVIKYVDKSTVTITYTIWVEDLYNQDSFTHDMQQFSLSRTEFSEVGTPTKYGSVGGTERQYVATAKYYNPLYEWYKTMNVPADLDKLYGEKFKPFVYDAPSDDAHIVGYLGGHGGPAYLYAVDVNDMFPSGMVGEWCMMTGGVFIPKSLLSDINMAEGNTVGSPGHRVDPVFSFAGGKGTKDDPYLIKTAEQLNAVRLCYSDKFYYKMIADIDLSNWGNWVPIGGTQAYGGWPSNSGYAHYNSFCFGGSFDGNGHTVSGMTIKVDMDKSAMDVSYVEQYYGLFAATAGYSKIAGADGSKLIYDHWGEIKNLTVKDFNIDVTYRSVPVQGEFYAGGLAGLSSSTHITNCKSVGGKINIQVQRPEGTEHALSVHAAGLVGVSRDAQFKNCSSNSTVNVRSSSYEVELFDQSEVHALVNKTIGSDSTTLTNSKGTGKVSLTNAAPAAATSKFKDVKTTDYFFKPVEWAVGQAITAGVGNNNFGPNQTCTRAQIIMFLWRAVGCPKPKTANPFKDVKTTDYYYNAAIWAYNLGMVSGTEFKGDTPCTRSATMTYIWKASGAPQTAPSDKFKDVPKDADYAQAVAWALSKSITAGTSDTTFGSNDTCTRGQIATFLYRVFGTPLAKMPPLSGGSGVTLYSKAR